MMNGNYRIFNCKKILIDEESGGNIPGIYNAIESTEIPLKFTNINNNGEILTANFGESIRVEDSIYYVDLGNGYEMKVEADDDVSIVEKASGGVNTGYIEVVFTDGVATIDNTHKGDLNCINITINDDNVLTVSHFLSPYMPIGSNILIPVYGSDNVLQYYYVVLYAGIMCTLTKVTLS